MSIFCRERIHIQEKCFASLLKRGLLKRIGSTLKGVCSKRIGSTLKGVCSKRKEFAPCRTANRKSKKLSPLLKQQNSWKSGKCIDPSVLSRWWLYIYIYIFYLSMMALGQLLYVCLHLFSFVNLPCNQHRGWVVRMPALWPGGCNHTKVFKNSSSCSLAWHSALKK